MHYPREVIDEIRMGNDIVDVIGDYVKLTKRGGSYVGLCPFHKEKTPSFSVNAENQFYHCFGCNASGNVISFIMEHEGYSFVDAVTYLADRINYTLPEIKYSEEYNKTRELKQRLYELHKISARFYYDTLISDKGKVANDYLDKRRITKAIRNKFGLGCATGDKNALYNHLKEKGFDDDIIFRSGLAYETDNKTVYDKFRNRLMFPIIDVYGNVIAFGGRTLVEDKRKYLNSNNTDIFIKSDNLYNLNLAKKSRAKELILVEGYMDAITVYQAGFKNVVASLGTAFNSQHTKLLKNYANSAILLFDSDEAGTKAILRTIPVLTEANIKVKVVQVTDAKDPDEYIKKYGASAFGELIRNAKSHILFQADQIRKNYDLELLEDRIAFTTEVARLMSSADNKIEADAYIKEISNITNIDIKSIQAEMDKLNIGVDTVAIKQNISRSIKKDGLDEAKRGLINIIASDVGLYNIFKSYLKPEYMSDDIYSSVINIIYGLYEEGQRVIPSDIVSRFEDIKEQNKVSGIFINKTEYTPENLEKAFNDQLRLVLKSYYTQRLSEERDIEKLRDISQKLKEINNLYISLV